MKKIKILMFMAMLLLSLTSCEKWLDVSPSNLVDEDEMFASGNGYRNALNGIYIDMSQQSLYGRELTWGAVDVIGQMYDPTGIHQSHVYLKFMDYLYEDKNVKSVMESAWSTAYTAVANCNNLIANVENEDPAKFAHGEMERQMILGEALALRAFIQFDMLRLFAPAPILNDAKPYVPYYDTRDSNGNPNLPVDQFLAKVVADLQRAQKALAQCDLLPENAGWFEPMVRMLSGTNSNVSSDLFLCFRGYRMNYYATTATLARVYCYMGKMDLAATQAKIVLDVMYESGSTTVAKAFPLTTSFIDNNRGYEEVIFSLCRQKIYEEYREYTDPSDNNRTYLVLNYDNLYLNNELSQDIRHRDQTSLTTGRLVSTKFYNTSNIKDMIPVIRITEMMYILAEQAALNGKYDEAIDLIDNIRLSKGVIKGNIGADSYEVFVREMLRDIKKDQKGEGQLFFHYKRLNRKLTDKTVFVFARPDNEDIN